VSRADEGESQRPVRYLRGNFVYGRRFLNDADHPCRQWLEHVANVRVGRTHESPRVRLERDERPLPRCVLAPPCETRDRVTPLRPRVRSTAPLRPCVAA
jgi:hypothetical protein